MFRCSAPQGVPGLKALKLFWDLGSRARDSELGVSWAFRVEGFYSSVSCVCLRVWTLRFSEPKHGQGLL